MTLMLVAGEGTEQHFVELDNQARGLAVAAGQETPGTWQEAMADEAFVRDQESFLELAADADNEILDPPV